MILNFREEEYNYPLSICSLNGIQMTNIKTFKYLGCKIKYKQPGIGKFKNSKQNELR